MKDKLRDSALHVLDAGMDPFVLDVWRTGTERQWATLLRWLDESGLALYFLARVRELGAAAHLPLSMLDALESRQYENRQRAAAASSELVRAYRALTMAGVDFLLLKGFSLVPAACPDPALRHQLDIDLMIESRQASQALGALVTLGYDLVAVSRDTWELKTPSSELPSRKDMYKVHSQRSLELHLVTTAAFAQMRAEGELITIEGTCIPVLSAVSRLFGQAEHIAAHMMSEWIRSSWLLEFRNVVHFHAEDDLFWEVAKTYRNRDVQLLYFLGTATAITRTLFPSFPEIPLLRAAEAALPQAQQHWIAEYGRKAMMASFPGTKLYLLQPATTRQFRRRRLLPLRLPPSPVVASDRTPAARWRGLRTFCAYAVARAVFHLREGARFLWEAQQWRRSSARTLRASAGTAPDQIQVIL